VERFRRTVDDHFAGERAELMKARAEQIAGVFQVKLGLWRTFTSEAASESSDARKQEALRSSGR
jgi:hypothetical protein